MFKGIAEFIFLLYSGVLGSVCLVIGFLLGWWLM